MSDFEISHGHRLFRFFKLSLNCWINQKEVVSSFKGAISKLPHFLKMVLSDFFLNQIVIYKNFYL